MCSALVARGAQHAHRVIVRQHHVLDRLVGDGADVLDHRLRHLRRRLRIDHHDRIVADHDAGVGIALGREGIGVLAEAAEGDLLLRHVRLRGEGSCHLSVPLCLLMVVSRAVLVVLGAVAGAHRHLESVAVALHAQRDRGAGRAARPQLLVEVGDVVQHLAVQRLQDVAALQPGAIGRAALGDAADHELAHMLDGIEAEPRPRRRRELAASRPTRRTPASAG